ncbi:hypothetical protein [Pedobacter nototheniae]|nr:hypothetical protein [Pedobacter nototheniae]
MLFAQSVYSTQLPISINELAAMAGIIQDNPEYEFAMIIAIFSDLT